MERSEEICGARGHGARVASWLPLQVCLQTYRFDMSFAAKASYPSYDRTLNQFLDGGGANVTGLAPGRCLTRTRRKLLGRTYIRRIASHLLSFHQQQLLSQEPLGLVPGSLPF
jgi:hypothetical protein